MSRPSKARARHRRRGSAYVEALLVTSLLIFLWIGALAFGRLYAMKLATVIDARADAWRATAGDCPQREDPLSRALDELSRSPDAARGQALLRAAEHVNTQGAARSSVRRSRGLLPFSDRDRESILQTTTRFACNESSVRSVASAKQLTAQHWVSGLLRGVQP